MIKYEARRSFLKGELEGNDFKTYRQEQVEFDTMEEAKAYVEANLPDQRGGQVITWSVYPNLPHCLPKMRYSSCALIVYQDGEWKGVNIHC